MKHALRFKFRLLITANVALMLAVVALLVVVGRDLRTKEAPTLHLPPAAKAPVANAPAPQTIEDQPPVSAARVPSSSHGSPVQSLPAVPPLPNHAQIRNSVPAASATTGTIVSSASGNFSPPRSTAGERSATMASASAPTIVGVPSGTSRGGQQSSAGGGGADGAQSGGNENVIEVPEGTNTMPLAFEEMDPDIAADPAMREELERIQDEFVEAISGPDGAVPDDIPLKEWRDAQWIADERYRMRFGHEAWLAQQRRAAQALAKDLLGED